VLSLLKTDKSLSPHFQNKFVFQQTWKIPPQEQHPPPLTAKFKVSQILHTISEITFIAKILIE